LKTTAATAANAVVAAANRANTTAVAPAYTTAVAPAVYTTADVNVKEKVTRLEQAQMREAFALSLNVAAAATAGTTTTTVVATNATAAAAATNMTAAVAATNTTVVAPAAANITAHFDVKEKVTRSEQAQMREALALSVNVTAVAPTASTRTAANATSAAIAAVDNGPSSGHAAGPASRLLAHNRCPKSLQVGCSQKNGAAPEVDELEHKPPNLCYPGSWACGSGLEIKHETLSRFRVFSCCKTQSSDAVEFWQVRLEDVDNYYHIVENDSMLLDATTKVCFAMVSKVHVPEPQQLVSAAKLLMKKHPMYTNLSGHADGRFQRVAQMADLGRVARIQQGRGLRPGVVPIKQGSAAMYGTRQSKNRKADGGLHNAPYKSKEVMTPAEQKDFDRQMHRCASTLSKILQEAFGEEAVQSMQAAVNGAFLPSVDRQGCASSMAVSHDFVRTTHKDAGISCFFVMWLGGDQKQYFVFPEYRVAVPARNGMSVLWNPLFMHGTSTAFNGKPGDRTALALINTKQTADAQKKAVQDGTYL
jgi:hypothetical protein